MDKRCRDCGEVKPVGDFYAHAGCRDGYRPECKACNLAVKAKKHRENPEPARARTRQWQADNPDRVKAKSGQYAAEGRKAISNRRSYLKRKYGITLERYDEMLEAHRRSLRDLPTASAERHQSARRSPPRLGPVARVALFRVQRDCRPHPGGSRPPPSDRRAPRRPRPGRPGARRAHEGEDRRPQAVRRLSAASLRPI